MAKSKTNAVKALAIIRSLLADQFHLPPDVFLVTDDLREKWLFSDAALVSLGKAINQLTSHRALVTPLEMVNCKTVGDLAKLLASKI